MAEHDGKTIDQPLFFTSWDGLIKYANNTQGIRYFKFDSENSNQYDWDNVHIEEQIEGERILYVDWNGCYIRNFIIDIPYSEETRDVYDPYEENKMVCPNMAIVFKTPQFFGMHWRNLEVENFIVKDPRLALCRCENTFHSCYFHNIVIESKLTELSDYWTTDRGDNVCPFGRHAVFSKSVLNVNTQNVTTRVPTVWLVDSVMNVNYKWTLGGSTNRNGIFSTLYPAWRVPVQGRVGGNDGSCDGENGIINVTVDLSKSQSSDNFTVIREPSQSEIAYYKLSGICSGTHYFQHDASLTINIKVINGANTAVEETLYQFSSIHYDTNVQKYMIDGDAAPPAECVNVTDNGDGLILGAIYGSSTHGIYTGQKLADPYTEYQLKNPDFLDDMEYNYITDDSVRYPVLYNDMYPERPSEHQTEYNWLHFPVSDPEWVKRKNPCVNKQYPFLPFDIYEVREMPVNNGEVSQSPYITIYDLQTAQNEFDNHGLAILCPTQCRIVEELNGAYNLTMTHPMDKEGKWQYILEWNIIKALGQLFVIQRVEEVTTGNSHYVTCYAEHISYTLNDRWLYPPFTIAGYNAQTLIDSIMAQSFNNAGGWQTLYAFTVSSDMSAEEQYDDWKDVQEGATPYDMFIGSNGLVSRLGGELYRDNFNISINSRMQNAQDNAFEIKIGYNITGIKRTVDLTTFCSYLKGYPVVNGEFYGDDGEWFAVAWDPSTLPRAYPREITRSVKFYYKEDAEMDKLGRDTMAYFNQVCAPIVSYEFNIKDLKRNPDYKDFENNYRFKVGDTGKVWDSRLKAWTDVEVSRTEKDGITGETTKVVIGNTRSFTRPSSYNPLVPNKYSIDAEKYMDSAPPLIFNADGNFLSDWVIHGAEGGVGDPVNDFNLSTWLDTLNTHTTSAAGTTYTGMVGGTVTAVTDGFTLAVDGRIQSAMTLSADYPMSGMGIPITVESSKQYTLLWTQDTSRPNTYVYIYNGSTQVAGTSSADDRQLTFTAPSNSVCLLIVMANASGESVTSVTYTDIVLTQGGYIIPVTIRHDASHSQTITLRTQSKLGVDNTISLRGTGIDIPTYSGSNTLTVDTTVQPSHVEIRYKEPIEEEE